MYTHFFHVLQLIVVGQVRDGHAAAAVLVFSTTASVCNLLTACVLYVVLRNQLSVLSEVFCALGLGVVAGILGRLVRRRRAYNCGKMGSRAHFVGFRVLHSKVGTVRKCRDADFYPFGSGFGFRNEH